MTTRRARSVWLSKSKLIAFRQCPRRLWLEVHRPDLKDESDAAQQRFAIGHQVGEIARAAYPDGILIAPDNDIGRAKAETKAALEARRRKPLFEATFEAQGLLVRTDLLLPVRNGWHMVEVKSSTKAYGYHFEDAAIQAWVVREWGLPLKAASLQLVDSSWVYRGGGDYRGLLKIESVDDAIGSLEAEVPTWLESARQIVSGPEPLVRMGRQCAEPFECAFQAHCSEGLKPAEMPIAWIPNLSPKRRATFERAGITDIREVCLDELTDQQRAVAKAYKRGAVVVRPLAPSIRRQLKGKRHYLDFETVQFGVPIWPGTRPYAQIPFQWSCHIEEPGKPLRHEEFLDISGNDPSAAFADSLISVLGVRGPVIVYGSFEKSRVLDLAARFPKRTKALKAIAARIVDLKPITREHYFHPGLGGSWSIKNVIRTIKPSYDYSNLDGVSDGMGASDAYLEAIDPETTESRIEQIECDLRRYCGRDTEAMIHVLNCLEQRN